jgi:hypothetical protein
VISDLRRWFEPTKEVLPPRCLFDDVPVGNTEDLHDTGELLLLVFSGEDWYTSVEFGEDASDVSGVQKKNPP